MFDWMEAKEGINKIVCEQYKVRSFQICTVQGDGKKMA
jgi:hypothetical protein